MLQIWANKNVSFLTKVFAGFNIPGFSLKAAQDIINAKPVLNPESEGGPLDKKNERTLMQRIKDLEFLIAVEKKFGKHAGRFAEYVVEKLSSNSINVEPEINEEPTLNINNNESLELSSIIKLAGI